MKKAAQAIPNELLRRARRERGWTQKDVADRIGAPLNLNVNRWERGTAQPSAHYVQRLCAVFEMSPSALGLLPPLPPPQVQQTSTSANNATPPAAADTGIASFSDPGRDSGTDTGTATLWNVPFARNPFFTGRSPLLERLHHQLGAHRSGAAPAQPVALSGLGGIGKTQAAIEYSYRYRAAYQAVFWLRADSRDTLIADYGAIARLLALPGHDAQEQMQVVTAVHRWLQEHSGWLLILDNADDLALVAGFLPQAGTGHLLLTTRAQATGQLARSLPVDKLEAAESLRLLLLRTKLLADDEPLENVVLAERKAAQLLVDELDGLPLALDQAGAYIEETGASLADYLTLYRHRRLTLLKRQRSLESAYPHTVANTWALSFAQVEQASPAATDLLRLCAFLHPDAIPESLLSDGAAQLGAGLQEAVSDPLLLNEALQLLRRYSLVKRDPEARLINLHRLVQVVLKESLEQAAQQEWAERTVRVVNAAFPEVNFDAWARCERYLPHVQVCANLITEHHLRIPEAVRLLHNAGEYVRERGHYEQAESFLQSALTLGEHVLGAEHPETARVLTDLGWLYFFQGKYEQVESLLEQALIGFERVLENEDAVVVVAEALNVLASVYMNKGQYARAEPLYQRALAIREQALGKNHPLVTSSIHNLGLLFSYQGKYDQAEVLFQRALAIQEPLGPEHPINLTSLQELASLYIKLGKYDRAKSITESVLATRELVLGPDHPLTSVSSRLLGRLYTLQGKYAQAEHLLQHALTVHERALGPQHERTLRDQLFLADHAQVTGQEEQAESLYRQVLTSYEQRLGSEHPFVADALIGLAQIHTRQRHYEQAEPLLQRALAIDEQALGPEHPHTAMVLDAQGHLAFLQGQEEQAEPILQRALAIQEKVLGNAHPDVARTLHHLAQLAEKQNKQEQSLALYQQALSIYEQALGAEHPDTVRLRKDFAGVHAGENGQAITGQ